MSFKTSLIKTAIKCTPNKMIIWVANMILKGIAELTDFSLDLEARKVYVQTILYGETETIEVWIDGFAITVDDAGNKKFTLQQAQANRPWLNNILARIVGKAWKIPALPQFKAQLDLVAELLKPVNSEEAVID